jgi:cytochrome c oxidase subunit 2
VVGRRVVPVLVLACALVLAGCGSKQDVLSPHSKQAHSIANVWWVMLGGATIGFAVVLSLLLLGWFGRNRRELPGGGGDRTATVLIVGLGVAVPIVVLTSLFVWSDIFVLRSVAAPNPRHARMTIDVVGHQWFWEIRYPGTTAVTANELHIPTHTPVNLVGTTADVIHSFWVPELHGKRDLIPSRITDEWIEADRPGRFRGQCAEFCGLQHAHMALQVYAEPPDQFRAWLADMAKPAPRPTTREALRGAKLFASESCSGCHRIRGTDARGQIGPDLTHLQTRHTLAAVTIPNDRAHLAAWILDPQHAKPGNKMPGLDLTAPQVSALVAYLEGLR